jgi:hypothetical protein
MSVVASDMKLRFSVAAAAGNTTAGTAAGALGDQISTTDITSAVIGNLFDDVSSAEALAGDVEYRGFFVLNDHATDSAFNVAISVNSQVSGGATFDLALDATAVSAKGSGSLQEVIIANENTAPAGAGAFGAGPLSIGTLAAGECKGVWARRTVGASTAALSTDGATMRVTGDG